SSPEATSTSRAARQPTSACLEAKGRVEHRANWPPCDREPRATGRDAALSPPAVGEHTCRSPIPDRRATMSIREDLQLLDQTQHELEFLGEEMEETHGIDRRDFVFWSLVTAAASTFGLGARAIAQAPTAAPNATPPQAAPPAPLGNGEPVSW